METGQQFPGNIPGSAVNRQVALGMPEKEAAVVSELSLPPNYQAEQTIKVSGSFILKKSCRLLSQNNSCGQVIVASSDLDALSTQGNEPLALTQIEFPFNLGQKWVGLEKKDMCCFLHT